MNERKFIKCEKWKKIKIQERMREKIKNTVEKVILGRKERKDTGFAEQENNRRRNRLKWENG